MQRQATPKFFSAAGKHTRKKRARLKNFCINTDHLGNTRVSFQDADGNGSIDPDNEVIETNDFYPFGLEQQKPNTTIGSTNLGQKFKYNGVELNEDLGLYEMEFRQYDPSIGRFTGMDLLSEQAMELTPYRFGFNNPTLFADPSGLWEETEDGWFTDDPDEITAFWGTLRGNDDNSEDSDNSEDCPECPNVSEAGLANYFAAFPEHSVLYVTDGKGTYRYYYKDGSPMEETTTTPLEKKLQDALGLVLFNRIPSIFKYVGSLFKAKGVPANKLHHIFGNSEHALDDLVRQFGSQEKTFKAVQQAANKALRNGQLTPNVNGVLPSGNAGNIINVGGNEVRLIGGRIIDGKVIISSFSRRGL